MNSANVGNQDSKQVVIDTPSIPVSAQSVTATSTGLKEHEPPLVPVETVAEISAEIEVPEEVEKAGVKRIGETIELPPDVKKLGVTHAGVSVPVVSVALPVVTLPISDQQVVTGLHAQVLSALRWLAEWCIKKLKRAHIALKVMHGKVMRVKN